MPPNRRPAGPAPALPPALPPALVLSLVFVFAGCAEWTPPVTVNDSLRADSAYLYGRFEVDAARADGGADGYQTVGLEFICRNGMQYTVRFSFDKPVQAIRVVPSRCAFQGIVYTSGDGAIRDRAKAANGFLARLDLKAGRAYYIGDYHAVTGAGAAGYRRTMSVWLVDRVANVYGPTTEDMKELYPEMAAAPTEDAMPEGFEPPARRFGKNPGGSEPDPRPRPRPRPMPRPDPGPVPGTEGGPAPDRGAV